MTSGADGSLAIVGLKLLSIQPLEYGKLVRPEHNQADQGGGGGRYDAAHVMAEREFFVICPNCGSEVSPYVTECPYCGNRLRKRAPDLKKQKKAEEKEERKAEKKRERLRAQYEGGSASGGGAAPGAWLERSGRPVATGVLVTISIVASILAASNIPDMSDWMLANLVYLGNFTSTPTVLLDRALHSPFGRVRVCLPVRRSRCSALGSNGDSALWPLSRCGSSAALPGSG